MAEGDTQPGRLAEEEPGEEEPSAEPFSMLRIIFGKNWRDLFPDKQDPDE